MDSIHCEIKDQIVGTKSFFFYKDLLIAANCMDCIEEVCVFDEIGYNSVYAIKCS